jgi:hypothetical protein
LTGEEQGGGRKEEVLLILLYIPVAFELRVFSLLGGSIKWLRLQSYPKSGSAVVVRGGVPSQCSGLRLDTTQSGSDADPSKVGGADELKIGDTDVERGETSRLVPNVVPKRLEIPLSVSLSPDCDAFSLRYG